jgi:hypothetical protein
LTDRPELSRFGERDERLREVAADRLAVEDAMAGASYRLARVLSGA